MRNAATILIVEDDERIRALMRTLLVAAGYAVLETGNATTALSMLASHSPELMLLDLGLPDRDGQELLREIRSWSRVPVVVWRFVFVSDSVKFGLPCRAKVFVWSFCRRATLFLGLS